MTVEACKAGKDVYVEKPICVAVDEGVKMVQAARKYNRVVQAGTMQRSAKHFQKAVRDRAQRRSGPDHLCAHAGITALVEPEGYGNPPDAEPPPTLDWDMWLGPAPKRAVQCEPVWRGSARINIFPRSAGSGITRAA